jgi:hypothetical protein
MVSLNTKPTIAVKLTAFKFLHKYYHISTLSDRSLIYKNIKYILRYLFLVCFYSMLYVNKCTRSVGRFGVSGWQGNDVFVCDAFLARPVGETECGRYSARVEYSYFCFFICIVFISCF